MLLYVGLIVELRHNGLNLVRTCAQAFERELAKSLFSKRLLRFVRYESGVAGLG